MEAAAGDDKGRRSESWMIGIAVTIAGVLQLVFSHQSSGWISSVLINTGTASLLFVPLYVAQHRMETNVQRTARSLFDLSRDVQTSQADLRQSLEELQRTVVAQDAARRDERQAVVASIGHAPTCEAVSRALRTAINERVVSHWGLRVHVVDPTVYVFARFVPSKNLHVDVFLEKRDGQQIAHLIWSADESAASLMAAVTERLRAVSLHPGESFDATLVFTELEQSISVARSVKDRFALVDDMAGAQQYVPPQWIIYDWGIGAWNEGLQPYYIVRDGLSDSDLRRHMSEKIWLDEASFYEAMTTARLLDDRGRLNSRLPD